MTKVWWYRKNGPLPAKWSVQWAVANSLYWYLLESSRKYYRQTICTEVSTPFALALGDLVFYENTAGKVFHSAIVSALSADGPKISQHTYDALNISYQKPWLQAKTHYIKILF